MILKWLDMFWMRRYSGFTEMEKYKIAKLFVGI
jgi:hypothetical protein